MSLNALLTMLAAMRELRNLTRPQTQKVLKQRLTMPTVSHQLTYDGRLQMDPDLNRASPSVDDWELEPSEIAFQEKIASGAFGDLYKGAYCGQDVAIKIVRNVQDNTQQFQEFIQACVKALLLPCAITVCLCILQKWPFLSVAFMFAVALGIQDLNAAAFCLLDISLGSWAACSLTLTSMACCVMWACSTRMRQIGIRCCACVAGGDHHAEGSA